MLTPVLSHLAAVQVWCGDVAAAGNALARARVFQASAGAYAGISLAQASILHSLACRDAVAAMEASEQAAAECREREELGYQTLMLIYCGMAAQEVGSKARALSALRRARQLAEQLGMRPLVAMTQEALGTLQLRAAKPARARQLLLHARTLWTELHAPARAANVDRLLRACEAQVDGARTALFT